MRQETVVSFSVSLRETFYDSISFRVINKYDKSALAQISTVFEPVYHVAFRWVL